jgi:hypothetical protein
MSRKYRQKGYQDDDREPRRGGGGPRPRKEGPRGRGLGKPTATRFNCARCGTRSLDQEVALEAACAECGSDLHTCTNCTYFDSSAPNECRKPVEVRIVKKSKRNECELFQAKTVQEFASDSEGVAPSDAKSAFDDLFDF